MELVVGNVTVLHVEKEVKAETMLLVEQIVGCNAQRGPWSNYRDFVAEEENYTRPEEVGNTDYVEGITIDEDNSIIYWSQGDFTVGTNIADVNIETDVLLENYDEDIKRVRIGIKDKGIIILVDMGVTHIYRSKNGFICEGKWVEVTKNQSTFTHTTEPELIATITDDMLGI